MLCVIQHRTRHLARKDAIQLSGDDKNGERCYLECSFLHHEGSGGPDFILRRGRSPGHSIVALRYQEGAQEFDILAEEGVDGGFSMDVNEMAASSIGYQNLSAAERIRIARNIRDALVSQGFVCQVVADNRLI